LIVQQISAETAPLEDRVLLTEIVRALVEFPIRVSVEERISTAGQVTLWIECADADRGKVLGKAGETINAIRRLFSVIGGRDRRNITVSMAS